MSLLSGPVVFIDDEIKKDESEASQLLKALQASGRPVIAAEALPSKGDRAAWFEHWQTLSFVVIDWDLSPGSLGAVGGSTLSAFERKKLFDFLEELMKVVYCPIFIVSREDAGDIRRQVGENEQLKNTAGELDARITVFPKHVLMDDILSHLTTRVEESAALSVLTTWDQEFDAARNRLFIDFNDMEPDWPVYVWRMAIKDGVDAAFELSSVISSNLLTRVNPVAFEHASINDPESPATGAAVRKVLQGRTFVKNSRLSDRMVFPGDIFRFENSDPDVVWINISPVCQTVARPASNGSDPAPVRLHLIRGTRADVGSKTKFNALESRRKGPTGEAVHTLLDESPYYFEFADADFRLWDEVKESRIGRLLAPYSTRFQQKHAAYLQAEGLPRVDWGLYE